MTNNEKINAMSVGEKARFLIEFKVRQTIGHGFLTTTAIVDWLNSPAESPAESKEKSNE